MIRIGIEFDKTTVNGRTYRRVAPFVHGGNTKRIASHIVAGLFIIAFIWVALSIAPDVTTHPAVDVASIITAGR